MKRKKIRQRKLNEVKLSIRRARENGMDKSHPYLQSLIARLKHLKQANLNL